MDELRRSYERASLEESQVASNPMEQFGLWFAEAQNTKPADWVEVNSMTLATSAPAPSARMVLLKGVSEAGFVFYTSYSSRKGRELAANPHASLVLYWSWLERQVRIVGTVVKSSREDSENYFHSRPRGSQIAAVASSQSSTVSRESLEAAVRQLEEELGDAEVPCPEDWGGYLVQPTVIEFWQGRPSRLHDRIVYTRNDASWDVSRLSP